LNQLTEQADLVFEGTVVELQVQTTGAGQRTSAPKIHVPPKQASEGDEFTGEGEENISVAVGGKGGRMLFTQVTMAVNRGIVGDLSSSTITFKVAGGSDGQTQVIVHGMPRFELGKRYVVFLRPNYQVTGAPIVGVNQGCFEVAVDTTTGQEMMLNNKGDIVTGLENDRVIVRQNPANVNGLREQPEPPPVPDGESAVQARLSPEIERYFQSNVPPMTVNDFALTIRAMKESQQ
jgi:hypothetical protein